MGERGVKKPGKAGDFIYGRPPFVCDKLASPIQFRRIKTCAGLICIKYVYSAPYILQGHIET